ncbi:unnamed protein product [Closterium sp. NIES-54]
MSAATPFPPALPWHSQRLTHLLRRAPLPSPHHCFPTPPRRPVVVARALETSAAAAVAPAAATSSACSVDPPVRQPLAAANDATLSLRALLAGPASAALLLLLVAHGVALPPVAAVASAGMPAGVAEPAAVEEVRGARTCSAGDGEGQAQGWCAPTIAEDANGAASAGLTSGERFGLPEELRNRYVLLRHGRSLANERGLIVSSLVNGVAADYGLAAEGRQQAQRAGRQLKELLEQRGVAGRDVVVFASPFSRTQQTAALAAAELGIDVLGTRFQVGRGGVGWGGVGWGGVGWGGVGWGPHASMPPCPLSPLLLRASPLFSPSEPTPPTLPPPSLSRSPPPVPFLHFPCSKFPLPCYLRSIALFPVTPDRCLLARHLIPSTMSRALLSEELRERYFGHHLELNSHDLYPAVWVDDRKDATFRPGGDGESVLAVAQRTARLIQHIEEAVDG